MSSSGQHFVVLQILLNILDWLPQAYLFHYEFPLRSCKAYFELFFIALTL